MQILIYQTVEKGNGGVGKKQISVISKKHLRLQYGRARV